MDDISVEANYKWMNTYQNTNVRATPAAVCASSLTDQVNIQMKLSNHKSMNLIKNHYNCLSLSVY